MDSRTGRMVSHEEYTELTDDEKEYFIDLSKEAKDALEKLDKTYERKMDRESQLEQVRTLKKNKYRNKPCPCGSGKKYKKCCLHLVVK